ncbi:MAG: T9SS type A sorting domain-containing protein [candidate division Zixibacteria bacterium]|nr:T9SS type A sorting domain-containing protein [candidate division Zixibacteria bacterium]
MKGLSKLTLIIFVMLLFGGSYSFAQCDFTCSTFVATIDSVYPGHGTYPIMVSVTTDSILDYIKIELELEVGLTYGSMDWGDSEWTGTKSATADGQSLELQFTVGSVAAGIHQALGEIICTVDDTVEFAQFKYINHEDNAIVSVPSTEETCDAYYDDGGVPIYSADYWFELGQPTGYSYQGVSVGDQIHLALLFKPNFPVKRLKTMVQWDYDDPLYHCWDDFEANPDYAAYDGGNAIQRWVKDDDTVFEPSDSFYTLGWFTYDGYDYRTDYNGDEGFSAYDTLFFKDYWTPYVFCDSSDVSLGFSDGNHTNGGIKYPVYACSTNFLNTAYNPFNSYVDMVVEVDHSFWSQGYIYHVDIDSLALDTILSVQVPAGGNVQDAFLEVDKADSCRKIFQIDTDDGGLFQTGKYTLPNADEEIFTMRLVPSDSFSNCVGCNSSVDLAWTWQEDNRIYDYFHPNSEATKIIRADSASSNAYFNTSPGTVYSAGAKIDVKDNVAGLPDGIPIRSYRAVVNVEVDSIVNTNYYDEYHLYFTRSGGQFTFSGIDDGDFSIDWDSPDIGGGGTSMSVSGSSSTGEVDGSGTLLQLVLNAPGRASGTTDIVVDSVIFGIPEGTGSPLPPGDYYMLSEDGSCYAGSPKLADDATIPHTYYLSQSYPNPFNATAVIGYGIKEEGIATLEIYDMLGRKVKTLVSESKAPGAHQVTWNGRNDSGEIVGSGYYFYILRANDFSQTMKMTLLK